MTDDPKQRIEIMARRVAALVEDHARDACKAGKPIAEAYTLAYGQKRVAPKTGAE